MIANKKITTLLSPFLRAGIGFIFFFAGLSKQLSKRAKLIEAINDYKILPEEIVPAFATVLPLAEIIIGAMLFVGILQRISLTATGVMLLCFIIAISIPLARGEKFDCACFGFYIEEISVFTLLRDILMLGVVIFLFKRNERFLSVDSILLGESKKRIREGEE